MELRLWKESKPRLMCQARVVCFTTVSILGFLCAGNATKAQLRLYGNITNPTTYTVDQLNALPQTTLTASYTAGGTPVMDTYTGVSLWNLLTDAGGVTLMPGVKNDLLRNVIVATGSDGYKAVVALGEIAPNFGNRPSLAATSDTGSQLGLSGPDGPVRLVVPGDKAGGRYVSNLESLQVLHAPSSSSSGSGGVSSAFTLSGDVMHPGTFSLAQLEALGATTQTATYLAGGTPVTDTYTGVSLWSFLTNAGIVTDPNVKNDNLRKYLVATGSDGYQTVISLGEIDPKFGNQPDLIAYADTDDQLGQFGSDGFARLVIPGDTAGGRYVSNIVSLQVFDATVPEPGSFLLLTSGLAGIGLLRYRRSRREGAMDRKITLRLTSCN